MLFIVNLTTYVNKIFIFAIIKYLIEVIENLKFISY